MNSSRFSDFITDLQSNAWYALGLLILALAGAALLIYEFTPLADPNIVAGTVKIDLAIACIFLTDFFLGLFFNKKYSKKEYWRKNWLDFISSIPITADMARALRIFRALRALRVISSSLDIWFTRKKYNSVKKNEI